MIYLTTGANGAGKTLLTLKDVRAQQLKENRPVYYHGFDMDEAKAAEFGWQKFDPKKWQDLPDGSICIMDECQNEFPLRRSGAEVPDYVQAIAQLQGTLCHFLPKKVIQNGTYPASVGAFKLLIC